MELWQLRYFAAVSEAQSIAQASLRLNVAGPAISRAIKALEDEFGVRLFDRDGRGMRLTETGRVLLDRATRLLRDAELARRAVLATGSEPSGEVTIGATPSLIAIWGATLIQRCRSELPKVQLRLIEGYSSHLLDWVRSATVDFALVNGLGAVAPRLSTEHLATERLFVVGSHDRVGTRDGYSLQELLQQPLLLPRSQNSIRDLLDTAASRLSLTVSPIVEVDSVGVSKELVIDGMALAVLPYGAVRREIQSGLLVAVPVTDPEVHSHTHLAYSTDRPPERVGRMLIDAIRAILADFAATHASGAFVRVQ